MVVVVSIALGDGVRDVSTCRVDLTANVTVPRSGEPFRLLAGLLGLLLLLLPPPLLPLLLFILLLLLLLGVRRRALLLLLFTILVVVVLVVLVAGLL